ncbi:hypothetical protein RTG_02325 [Rhodotorula toruloides ATCC 204091]|nr:hypothetical protein RTG_02325 [Rhodotorula toruloides ATCC 204091]KAK4336456.1 hypothetical protein RTBOTA2_005223 [Rhodotorula toruloides]
MKPLRMKETSNPDEAVLRAERRAARKSRKKRPARDESLTPPRSRSRPPATTVPPEDWGFDESALPPEQAYKKTRTDDEFYESLADAEAQDQGVGHYEDELYARQVPAYASHYGSAAAAAAGIEPGGKGNWLNQMDDEEYAEWVRAGMWRRRNKEETERIERAEKERKVKEERERIEREKRTREERERIRKLEERKKRKSEEEEKAARTRYDDGWKKLQQAVATTAPAASTDTATDGDASSSGTSTPAFPLRFTDFPWPLYPPMAFPPLSWPSHTDITSTAISTFLLPPSLPADKHKGVVRQAVLAYHPDRFERYVLKIPEEKEDVRERVRELGLRVSQVLNDLSKKGS